MDSTDFSELCPSGLDVEGSPAAGAIAVAPAPPLAVTVEPLVPVARPLAGPIPASQPSLWQRIVPADTDSCALASAVCGFTAIIPVISQVAGVAFGVAGLLRIRRARRAGQPRSGVGWACAGLVTSGVALAGWIVIFIAFAWVQFTISGVTSELSGLRPSG